MSTQTWHGGAPVLTAGARLASAKGALILLHGRGASAEDILGLGAAIGKASLAMIAPQAANHTWYPYSFLAPRAQNEPWLSSALEKLAAIVEEVKRGGIGEDRIVIAGFSQGACLATEFVASHPARYAGLIAFTGGLIGEPGSDLRHAGSLAGTPALLLSGDPDPHVPWSRVEESAAVLSEMGAAVTAQRFPGRSHTVSAAEIGLAQEFLEAGYRDRV
ncbi:alpha/beta hydrolase [Silvibacterium dinghuense]|uniref:Phospholipase n=1 Tax=Silvibacterium dinghuense TaxID=1560006 RepID=A0A4Q1SGC4_9BACT|nr:dienelactone hydrolase family protein [Silvibacterium dinghuense]RXS96405.1 phospholipase [Silvibacterium dinghuense]GGG90515.1 phospholipase/carboxylesterase [Silvibacterium dinghuense]